MISGNLEYLMSSLPYLSFGNTEEEQQRVSALFNKYGNAADESIRLSHHLTREAAKYLSGQRMATFQEISLETVHLPHFQDSNCKVLADFANFSFRLKKEVQRMRLARKSDSEQSGKPQAQPIHPGNPLEEEVQLMQLQWDQLEKLGIGHYTDFDALVVYKLKLLVLERWWSFDQERGMKLFLQTTERD